MNQQEWRDFQKWLDTASLEQLRSAQEKIEALLPQLRSIDVRREARQRLTYIEKEILLRTLD